jgi:hypothetical protein
MLASAFSTMGRLQQWLRGVAPRAKPVRSEPEAPTASAVELSRLAMAAPPDA